MLSTFRTRVLPALLAIAMVGAQALFSTSPAAAQASDKAPVSQPVTVTDNGSSVTLDNGVVALTVNKANANMLSFKYQGHDIIKGKNSANAGRGYWNVYGQIPGGIKTEVKGTPSVLTLTQDPAKNGGQIAEIELLFPYKPGAASEPVDIAIRYTLKRGDSGVYGWTSVSHKPGYPPFNIEASTVAMKLNPDIFDHLIVDSRRNLDMSTGTDWIKGEPLNLKEARRMTTGVNKGKVEHKYDYAAMFSETPAYGWTSNTEDIGVWIINPSLEYMNGGPTRIELTGHVDIKDQLPADPTLLFIWHGPHYGGLTLPIAEEDTWQKVVGPFLIYANSGPDNDAMWKDATARAFSEQKQWPYDWAKLAGYANARDRGAVKGKLVVRDPQNRAANAGNAWVGLAHAPYTAMGQNKETMSLSWETDAKHYGYWARADKKGAFTIPNARPGTYVLYAFNDGVLGDYAKANVTVEAGKTIDLGALDWVPVRYGKQIWEIGVPNRSAEEFRHGDHYWQWGLYNKYPQEFPNDVKFVIGKSDIKTDWNYVQPPLQGADGKWTGRTWQVLFDMPNAASGKATLRLAIAGSRGNAVNVEVNGVAIGGTGKLPNSGVMHRDGIRSVETIIDLPFDAALLRPGQNRIDLKTTASSWTEGVLYDYLRLEIDGSPVAAK